MKTNARPEDVGLCSKRLQRISEWMRRYVDAGTLPFAMTLVARGGRSVFFDMCGQRDLDNGRAISADTLMRFYSMTKPVTSVAAMMLYEEGRFQLDQSVSDFVPCLANMRVYESGDAAALVTRETEGPITFHHLLTHTAGFTYGFGDDSAVSRLYREHRTDFGVNSGSLESVVKRLSDLPLRHEPGTKWNYGVSTDVLGYLVEVLSGQSLREFFERRIFRPLNMVDTDFGVPDDKIGRFSCLYGPDGHRQMKLIDPSEDTRYRIENVTTFSGGGGLISTMSDYARFTSMLRGRGEYAGQRLLGRKTLEYMTCNHLPGDLADMGQATFNETTFEGIGFGLGFSVMLDPAKAKVVGSPGEFAWGGMASTAFWIDPVEDMTVIFLTQLSPSSTYPLRRELRVLTYQSLIGA